MTSLPADADNARAVLSIFQARRIRTRQSLRLGEVRAAFLLKNTGPPRRLRRGDRTRCEPRVAGARPGHDSPDDAAGRRDADRIQVRLTGPPARPSSPIDCRLILGEELIRVWRDGQGRDAKSRSNGAAFSSATQNARPECPQRPARQSRLPPLATAPAGLRTTLWR
jgi:hypothetical protein